MLAAHSTDPDFVDVPLETLLSDEYNDARSVLDPPSLLPLPPPPPPPPPWLSLSRCRLSPSSAFRRRRRRSSRQLIDPKRAAAGLVPGVATGPHIDGAGDASHLLGRSVRKVRGGTQHSRFAWSHAAPSLLWPWPTRCANWFD